MRERERDRDRDRDRDRQTDRDRDRQTDRQRQKDVNRETRRKTEKIPLVELMYIVCLLVCQMRVTVGDSALSCCVRVTSVERLLTPLFDAPDLVLCETLGSEKLREELGESATYSKLNPNMRLQSINTVRGAFLQTRIVSGQGTYFLNSIGQNVKQAKLTICWRERERERELSLIHI